MLADPAVDAVLNLTSHGAHAEVTARSLEAGKHVHSEKPMAGSYGEASPSSSSPTRTGCGSAARRSRSWARRRRPRGTLIAQGAIGTVRVVYAEVNWGRIERWHPAPAPFYGVGPLVDVGVYPLTILTAMFGPARSVTAYGRVVLPDRDDLDGEPFVVETPDFGVAAIELESGPVVRLTTSFYVGQHSKQSGIEFHGDTGSLHLDSWQDFDSGRDRRVRRRVRAGRPHWRRSSAAPTGVAPWPSWRDAIRQGRPHRADAAHAAHVIEILDAIAASMAGAGTVPVTSTFAPPAAPNGAGPAATNGGSAP